MRILGNASEVFRAIKTICGISPYMTLKEAGAKGLLDPKLQHTEPYEVGKYPYVHLDSGIEWN
jgi:hypothetical protein